MPSEHIGSCGIFQGSGAWAVGELKLGICYILHACGEPPKGYELAIVWHEHELGDYPAIGISWEGPYDAPPEYIRDAERALSRFNEAVDWAAIDPGREPDVDDHAQQAVIELYRRDELLELQLSDWQMALLIFREMGWTPKRPLEAYSNPLSFVPDYEGEAMHNGGAALFTLIKAKPLVSVSVQMDLGLFYHISEFVGGGAFIIGEKGAYAEAKGNGDF